MGKLEMVVADHDILDLALSVGSDQLEEANKIVADIPERTSALHGYYKSETVDCTALPGLHLALFEISPCFLLQFEISTEASAETNGPWTERKVEMQAGELRHLGSHSRRPFHANKRPVALIQGYTKT
jgi:hypothetical protein